MELDIRIYTIENNYKSSRLIKLNELEVLEMLDNYIKSKYLKSNEKLEEAIIEGFHI